MKLHHRLGKRHLAATAGVALTAGFAMAGPAQAQAAVPSASVTAGTLTIVGTGGDDAITAGLAATDPGTLLVDLGDGGDPQAFDRTTFTAISVFLRGGNDRFQVVPGGGSLVDEALTVVGGFGNDAIVGGDGNDNLSGGAGADTVLGADGNDLIFGNRGNDSVNGNRGTDTEFLGSGRDEALWNPGEGSDVVDGGAAADSLIFNGSDSDEIMSLSGNGSRAVFLRDPGAVRMDLNHVENLELATFGGVDAVTIGNLAGTDIGHADIDLSSQGAGDHAADTVTVDGTNSADQVSVDADNGAVGVTGLPAETRLTGSETTDQLTVRTLGGNDHVGVSQAATSLIGVVVDLGTGQN